jgi:hypothetical protein
MRSDAVFIPHEGDHLSAVIGLPEGRALGVAIFPLRTPQLGVAGNVFWALAAERLAARSVASVRFDHAGSGDSTGTLASGLGSIAEPVRETLTVARFAMAVLELDGFATAGSCYGGAVVLEAARDSRCRAAVSINTAWVEPGTPARIRRASAQSRLIDAVRSRARLRRLVQYDRVRRWLRDGVSPEMRAALEDSARHARLLLIDDEGLDTRGIGEAYGHYEVRRDIAFGMIRVDAVELDAGEQRVLDALVDWIVESVGVGPRATAGTPPVAGRTRHRDRAPMGTQRGADRQGPLDSMSDVWEDSDGEVVPGR